MRSKRLLAALLVFCLVLGTVSPAVNATTVSGDSFTGVQKKPESVAANKNASSFDNDHLVANGEANGTQNLRDEAGYMPNVEDAQGMDAEGKWVASEFEGELPDLNLTLSETPEALKELKEAAELYKADDMVTAFVVMEDQPLAEIYSSILDVSWLDEEKLVQMQNAVIRMIEKLVLDGEKLDVRYQFTYLTNAFSVETAFGNLAQIAQLDGVKSVYLMPVYNACTTSAPNATSSGEMTGVPTVWENLSYRGEGMKIAIVDTGLDLDHPSFAEHDDFVLTEDSLTAQKIDAVLKDLNAYELRSTIVGKTLYRSAKVPYAFNYVDENLTADHSSDMQGDHGTHVAGIAGANDNTPGTDVVGMAPEAQLIIMKVFGANGGAYTDDIIAALEDAMTLGCDVANLSLGAPAGFTSENEEIDAIYDRIAEQDMVVCISAGNEGTSSYGNMWGTNLNTTSNPDTAAVGSPGTYANVTTVASAENAVIMTPYFTVGGQNVFYNDPYMYVIAMPEIIEVYGDTYEYVVIDGLGYEENFYDAEGNSLVEGKIAVIKRGELSFGTKINNAAYAGAVAAVIWNNVEEDIFNFGMQISDDGENYPYIPACFISLSDGQMMADAEDKTMVLTTKAGARGSAAGGQMSSFSSWGMAPDLTLEPDITGVGGNVYSCYDGGTYGLMSGTSMSSPQVAGVTALVVQYLKDNYPGLEKGEIRKMAEALMMSNAEVIISSDSNLEASPRQQGAGLVNAASAVSSEAYLMVNGDKPKVSMGDNADGIFTFSFEVYNISDAAKTYTLDSSLLTEAVVSDGYNLYMANYEMELTGAVSFSTDEVTVPANSSVTVDVTITLSDEDKAFFAQCYPNGGYVEGYIYLNSMDEASLNLPFLGFYGDWTEPPMFDTAYWYDNSFWDAMPENGIPEGNEYWHVMWTSLAGQDWVLGFNPYTGAMLDENGNVIYDPANNSVSPNGDGVMDSLTEIYVSLMRNAKTLTITYTNADTGEVLDEEVITNARKTMYQSSYGQIIPWLYSWYGSGMYNFTDANGEYLANNTNVLLTISAEADYGDGGEHSIQIPITVDTQAPELELDLQYTYDGHQLALLVTDNVALADAFIMNKSGTQIWAEQSNFTMPQEGVYQVNFDVTGLGTEFVVVLGDYAGNESAYELVYKNTEAGDNLPAVDNTKLYGYRTYDNYIVSDHMYGWVSMNMPASAEEYANVSIHTDDYLEYAAINAAEYVDGRIFAVDAVYNLVVMTPGLWDRTTVANLGVNVLDMTFDDSTDTMYVLTKADNNVSLCTMDLLTGELTVVHDYGYYYYAPWSIADDDNGTLYANKNTSSNLFVLDENYELVALTDAEGNPIVIYDCYGNAVNPTYAQSMTYVDGILYWSYFTQSWRGEASSLICIDVEALSAQTNLYAAMAYDGEGNLVEYYPTTELVGLHTLAETDYQIPDAEALESLWMESTFQVLREGDTTTLKANPLPWNYKVTDLVWTSSDESVVTVDANGNVTAVAEGNAVVTATSGSISVSCTITVVDVDGNFYAYNYYSGDGNYGYMIDVDLGTMNGTLTAASPVDFIAGDYNGHDGYFYGFTEGGQLWKYNQQTNEIAKVGDPTGINPTDMAYDYSTGLMYAAVLDYNYGCSYIYQVNMNNGQMVAVMEFYDFLMTLACDLDGMLYAIGMYGDLYWIDVENYAYDVIMSELGDLQYMQSMCYDHNNDVILWTNPERSVVYWVDINNETPYAISLGDPTNSGLIEFVGMYTIPGNIPELSDVAVEDVTAEDMTMLAGVEKTANIAVMPFNATCQNAVLTSSDEAVVKITENGTLLAVAEGTATITYTLTDTVGGGTYEGDFTVTVLNPADDVYGHVLTDLATYGGQYWVRLYAQDTGSPDILEYTEYIIYAEEYYNGKLYAFGYDPNDWTGNWQMFILDPKTMAIEDQKDLGDGYPFVYDVTYDYATSTMYAVAGPSDNSSNIYVVDMETGELILLKQTEQFFMNIAATDKGIYLMEPSVEQGDAWDPWAPVEYTNATLYSFDPIAKTIEVVGDTGMKSNMLSSMSYDYDTGYLYWTPMFQGSSYISNLAIVDIDTGAATALGTIGMSGAQVSGLYIISENFPEEPEPVLNDLLVVPGKISVAAGGTADVKAYVLPLALDADVVWTSADRSVATVRNGVVTGIAQGKTTITATVTYGDITKTASCEVAVLDANASFLTYNTTDGGWAGINRGDSSTVTNLTEGEENAVSTFTEVNGVIYGYDAQNNLFTVTDTTLFDRTVIGRADAKQHITDYLMDIYGYTEEEVAAEIDLYGFEIRDLAYDAANDRLLALGNVYDAEWGELNYGNSIYEVDLETGKLTLLYTFYDIYYVMAMTCTADGSVIYYNAYNDYYTMLDLETGATMSMVSLQTQSYYGDYESDHTMYYDELTGMVYHLFTTNGSFYMMIAMDPVSSSFTVLSENVGEVIYNEDTWSDEGDKFTGLAFVEIGALGSCDHDLTAEFTWAEDYSACYATIACANCEYCVSVDCDVTAATTVPTCTEAGATVYTATFGAFTDVQTVEIPATGHTYEITASADATCTEDGFVTYTCHCGDTYTETIAATGHNHVLVEKVDATCTEDGYELYRCEACGDEYRTVLEATGHEYEDDKCIHCGEKDPDANKGFFGWIGKWFDKWFGNDEEPEPSEPETTEPETTEPETTEPETTEPEEDEDEGRNPIWDWIFKWFR